MARYTVVKFNGKKGFYARVYSNKGTLLDSLVFSTRRDAENALKKLKRSGLFRRR